MTTILVTGANRGIGLEHVRQALVAGETVIAACREPEKAQTLRALIAKPGQLRIEALDVESAASIDALAERLKGVAIDILINNAGIYGPPEAPSWPSGAALQSLDGMDYPFWEKMHRINVMGPFRLTARLMDNILAGKRKLVAMMSSELGSIAGNTMGTSHAYRSSKAALNMVAHGLAIDLKDKGVTVIALAPGWTQTDLGGDGAKWTVAQSVEKQRQVLAKASITDSGQFIDLTGDILPW